MARAVVLDLALLDHTGETGHWERAVSRAKWVAGRLAPDPEHGALIYHPGRLDPRNCSTSAIDSGECTDALARLLRHGQATTLHAPARELLRSAVERNADTYLVKAVLEKGITNQRLWAAMGLASAWALLRRDAWLDPLARSINLALREQRSDGSWGYQPNAVAEGAHPGAADLTVYYHSRCIAFLQHIAALVPALDTPAIRNALERALDFLALVTTPDGLKPLTLEGKRWFWDGSYEAGSAAYDVFALLRGASAFRREDLRALALVAWRQLARHQRGDGAIVACQDRGNADVVCPDFHTADLAWTVQTLAELPDPGAPWSLPRRSAIHRAPDAGVIRLDGEGRSVLIRTRKQPANTHFGGAVGGGTLAAVVDASGSRLLSPGEAHCVVRPKRTLSTPLTGLSNFLRANRPRREGSQLLFVVRLLARQGRLRAARRKLWRDWISPHLDALGDPASPEWTTRSEETSKDDEIVLRCKVARRDGSIPSWAAGLESVRSYQLGPDGLRTRVTLFGPSAGVGRLEYALPKAARHVQVDGEGVEITRRGRAVTARPTGVPLRLDVTYIL